MAVGWGSSKNPTLLIAEIPWAFWPKPICRRLESVQRLQALFFHSFHNPQIWAKYIKTSLLRRRRNLYAENERGKAGFVCHSWKSSYKIRYELLKFCLSFCYMKFYAFANKNERIGRITSNAFGRAPRRRLAFKGIPAIF